MGRMGRERIREIDALRGLAIILMVIYHIIFDLWFLGFADVDFRALPLLLFQRSIGTLFLLLVGVSLHLSQTRNREGYRHHLRRGLILGLVALAITLVTYIYPNKWFITFGIMHCIALSTLIAPLFFRLGRLNVLLGLIIIASGFLAYEIRVETPYLFWLGLIRPDYTALDFYPMLPWFGIVLIGVYAGQVFYPDGAARLRIRGSAVADALCWMGRNSLSIYLAHQPVIIGILLLYRELLP